MKELLAQGIHFPRRFLAARLSKGEAIPLSQLGTGEGRVMQVDRQRLAVHRDEAGSLHAVSPVCTHLGCLVDWNGAQGTWDCPCHGSRYAADGDVIRGPAKRPLERRELPDDISKS